MKTFRTTNADFFEYLQDLSAGELKGLNYRLELEPMALSYGIGADSYMTRPTLKYVAGENQQAQADANEIILKEVLENHDKNIGAFIFSFTDGLWKAGNPNIQDTGGAAPNSDGTPYDGSANEEYWGIVDINRNKKITFDVIKEAYLNHKSN